MIRFLLKLHGTLALAKARLRRWQDVATEPSRKSRVITKLGTSLTVASFISTIAIGFVHEHPTLHRYPGPQAAAVILSGCCMRGCIGLRPVIEVKVLKFIRSQFWSCFVQVHTWVQWLRAEITAIRTGSSGCQTHVDLKYVFPCVRLSVPTFFLNRHSRFVCSTVSFISRYVLANEAGPVEPVTTPMQNLDKEQDVPVGHIRYARGVSLESWLRMRQCPVSWCSPVWVG